MTGSKSIIAVLLSLVVNMGCVSTKPPIGMLNSGVADWNRWREENKNVKPNMQGAGLDHADLAGADFRETDLSGAVLEDARLEGADLSGGDLSRADL